MPSNNHYPPMAPAFLQILQGWNPAGLPIAVPPACAICYESRREGGPCIAREKSAWRDWRWGFRSLQGNRLLLR
jgi:hypothetical protein